MQKFKCRNVGDVMVSAAYKENIYPKGAPRKTVAEVSYSLSAPDSKEGGELNLPPGNSISRPWQVMNELRIQPAPVGTLEPEHWTLEGRFMIPVSTNVQEGLEIGFWSKSQSDEMGFFDDPLVIERIFDHVQTFNTLGIVFDPASGNCCTEFDVEFFDIAGQNNAVPVDVLDYSNVIGTPWAETNEYYNAISLAKYGISVKDRQISRTRHTALEVLQVAGIINSPHYWKNLLKENTVPYLGLLLIRIANRCRMV